MFEELRFDEGRDVDGLDLGKVDEIMVGAEVGELAHGGEVGAARVGIADVRAEIIAAPALGLGLGGEDRGQGSGGGSEVICH